MPKAIRTCKVCGKQYEACRSIHDYDGTFRWQMVACCEEHGRQYLNEVLAARAQDAAHDADRAPEGAEGSEQV